MNKCCCTHAPKVAMATPLSSPFSVTTLRAPLWHGRLHAQTPLLTASPLRASSGDDATTEPSAPTATTTTTPTDDDFEQRVLRMKSRVGPKKRGSAGARKRKAAAESQAVTLPPVPLREPRSALGLPVEFGFTAYSERLNGLLATVGLTALLLVELGSGKSLVKYHQAPTLFLQVYTIVAAGAVFVKYEKERISVWPAPAPPKAPATSGE
ncbi:uncharacterized protein LOC124697963 [Lolium rigidum]|uniref:uncharacterized protein LOC124697963 n=1 Tax=Lolium rigidum TaxID=89674 RepID=UPI001F5C78DF|nr:uncharacterized protein LOC124697963 [Lolium rigidum]